MQHEHSIPTAQPCFRNMFKSARLAITIVLLIFIAGCGKTKATPLPPTLVPTPTAIPIPSTSTPEPVASKPAKASVTPTINIASPTTTTPTTDATGAGVTVTATPTADAESATLASLEQIDDYPLYTMRYVGDYRQRRASAGGDEVARTEPVPGWACSLFAALTCPGGQCQGGDSGNRLYGRNFDWTYSPALLLFTDPPDGYASVSTVDLAYLVDADKVQTLAELPLDERRALLEAPFWPFDGMNEHGLVVGMAAVPPGHVPPDPDKETIDSLMVMREVLDRARDVDEAVAIIQSYNIDWGDGPPLHYLVADRSGQAVLVEFYDGQTVLIPNDAPWHQATNFLRAAAGESAQKVCWRYDRIHTRLVESEGRLTAQEGMDLLRQVAQENTQWSILYGMNSHDIDVVVGQDYDNVHTLHLDLAPVAPQQAGDAWQTASLEEVGIDRHKLSEVITRVHKGTYQNIHSILIVKDGKLVFEEYFEGYTWDYDDDQYRGERVDFGVDTPHNLASVTKSFTSALVGIAIDHGFIPGVDEKLFTFFPDYAHLNDEQKEKISLEHLLTMTSGLEWNEMELPYSNTENDLVQLFLVPDPLEYILAKPAIYEPGTIWYYGGGNTNLLGKVIKEATGLRMDDFAAEYLFAPLGITNYEWDYIKPDMVHASGNLKLRPRDMAKFGYLYLNGGVWQGQRIISEKWVEVSTKEQVSLSRKEGYGYQWWQKTYGSGPASVDAFYAAGWGGQRITVFPSLDMVVVFTGGNYVGRDPVDNIIAHYILPAVQ